MGPAVGIGTYVSALICQNFEVSLETSIAIVTLGGVVIGWLAGGGGAFARNWLHADAALDPQLQMRPGQRALLQTIGNMLPLVVAALLLSACAAARISSDGAVTAWAFGQAKVERCTPAASGEPVCVVVAGGALSEGLLGSITGLIRGLLPAALSSGS